MRITCFSSIEKRPLGGACIIPFAIENGVVVPLFEDSSFMRAVHNAIASKDFQAKEKEVLTLYVDPVMEPRLVLVGLGEKQGITVDKLREAFSAVASSLSKKEITSISCIPPILPTFAEKQVLRGVLEGLFLGTYSFSYYKTSPAKMGLVHVACCTLPHVLQDVESKVRSRVNALTLARDLVNKNADEIHPEGFCAVAQSLASKGLVVEVHDAAWIKKERMNLLLAVAQGAAWEPRFLIVRWNGAPKHTEKTILVGKGITFDTGGLNLKGTDNLKAMKGDMAGAAAALGVMQAVRDLELPINVTAVIPLCENSIGERAYKPDDVFISRAGISVEIANTDAEGRLILADSLDYVKEHENPSRIIDIATLTGAAEVALGSDVFALFSNTDSLCYELQEAAHRAGDYSWRLPLHQDYMSLLDSDLADCKNVGIRYGGAIIAALFLQKFVGNIPWAHLDIAGPAFLKDARRYYPRGATGVPVRTIIEFLEGLCPKVIEE
jgi:leucyl aminopeptidase